MTIAPIEWHNTDKAINTAIYWAAKKLRYSIDRPGMNRREIWEALDDKIMGDCATLAVLHYLYTIKVPAVAYDHIRKDDFKKSDPGWDIAIGSNANNWSKTTSDPTRPNGLTTISIKSSRLPRNDTLNQAIETRDFKIFKHSNNIANDITTDIELQVYYPYEETLLGDLRVTEEEIDQVKILNKPSKACEVINKKLNIKQRWGTCYLIGYNNKQSIIDHSSTINPNTWSSFGKEMWIAPLRHGKNMSTLNTFIDN